MRSVIDKDKRAALEIQRDHEEEIRRLQHSNLSRTPATFSPRNLHDPVPIVAELQKFNSTISSTFDHYRDQNIPEQQQSSGLTNNLNMPQSNADQLQQNSPQ